MKVLMADDDPVSRRLLQSDLQKWGYDVTLATDGAEAWRLFEAGDFSLVISDWIMPGMDGPELIRRIRAGSKLHYVYTILLTSMTHKDDLVQGMEAGADDFISKPFDRHELHVTHPRGREDYPTRAVTEGAESGAAGRSSRLELRFGTFGTMT